MTVKICTQLLKSSGERTRPRSWRMARTGDGPRCQRDAALAEDESGRTHTLWHIARNQPALGNLVKPTPLLDEASRAIRRMAGESCRAGSLCELAEAKAEIGDRPGALRSIAEAREAAKGEAGDGEWHRHWHVGDIEERCSARYGEFYESQVVCGSRSRTQSVCRTPPMNSLLLMTSSARYGGSKIPICRYSASITKVAVVDLLLMSSLLRGQANVGLLRQSMVRQETDLTKCISSSVTFFVKREDFVKREEIIGRTAKSAFYFTRIRRTISGAASRVSTAISLFSLGA